MVDLLSLQSEQGESVRLPDFDYNNVYREFDIRGGCLRLFVLVQATNNTPRRLLPAGKGGPRIR